MTNFRIQNSVQITTQNMDEKTVESFGSEWSHFNQRALSASEISDMFNAYFQIFPWGKLPENCTGFDMGCGSGRWAKLVALRVGHLNCIDPSPQALNIARESLQACSNVSYYNADTESVPIEPNSQDFGYSLGVLHHIPDTQKALEHCVELLKPNSPFLLYLYYRFDNRPKWFRFIWKVSDRQRKWISSLPNSMKPVITDLIAAAIYWPLAKIAAIAERIGLNIKNFPLNAYRQSSFYTMRTDARDRFGTPLEQRFTRAEIETMMKTAGLTDIQFSENQPFWCAVGWKCR